MAPPPRQWGVVEPAWPCGSTAILLITQPNTLIPLVAGFFCDHVAVVPYHEKAVAVVNTCAVEVLEHGGDSGMEAGAGNGVLGVMASGEQGVKNEAVVCSELWAVVHGEPRVENKAVVHGEKVVAVNGEKVVKNEAVEHGEKAVAVNGEQGVNNEAAVHGEKVVVHSEPGVVVRGELEV
ncbi:hypothetical protein HU200_053092 [Digitaria exilis]|uniref:Uncharacterized protein n=1 Tax=Digitaria exilis TaxID=1010633 RepID=A0A835ALA6_9POAL|nr:hypothetical protein HU200_053092 [Digitaria exilis]